MKCLSSLLLAVFVLFAFVACSSENRSTPDYNPIVGPFDKDGNYVEAWADNPPSPTKKSWSHRNSWFSKDKPQDEPDSKTNPTQQLARNNSPATQKIVYPTPTPALASNAHANYTPAPVMQNKPSPKPVAQSRPKPKPKPVVQAKPKPKPVSKPASKPSRRHKVVKGDTLYNISNRYGTSVSALQKANNISGTNIRLGQTLKIP